MILPLTAVEERRRKSGIPQEQITQDLSCHVSPDVSLTSDDVRSAVTTKVEGRVQDVNVEIIYYE